MVSTGELRARVRGRIWQAFAQAGVTAPALPKEGLEALVDELTDAILIEVDAALEGTRASAPAEASTDDDEERTLWEGRPFLSLVEHYTVTTERLRIVRGLFGRDREDIELVRVQDIDHTQTLGERLISLGDVTVRSADPSHPQAMLRNVRDPEEVHEVLRRAVLEARRRSNFAFREQM